MNCLIFICLLYWVVLSERFTMEGVIIGTLIVIAVLYFNKDSLVNIRFDKFFKIKRLKYWGLYVLILIKEIVMSNFHVAKIVLSPNLRISPMIVKINTGVKSHFNRVVLANSITLTPGTFTIIMENDELTIHCLEEESAEGLTGSDFERIIMKAEE